MASGFLPACSIGLSLQGESREPFASSNLGQRVSEPTQPMSHESIEWLEESTRIDQSKRRRVPFWLPFTSVECRLRSRGLLRFGQLLTDQYYIYYSINYIFLQINLLFYANQERTFYYLEMFTFNFLLSISYYTRLLKIQILEILFSFYIRFEKF